MENRVYYGEYSLQHWIDLILKKNIILPDYQRYFVWDEKKVTTLIETFKKKQFVPPITIGSFKNGDSSQNLILDGQQRLTSILLAYLGLFPDETTFKIALERFLDENDDPDEHEEQLDNIYDWTFNTLTDKGKSKEKILEKIIDGNYKRKDYQISEAFLKNTFLGFSFLVPHIDDEKIQQKYYSSVFRNINVQGETLLPQESRASLYFLDKGLAEFFNPNFIKSITIRNVSSVTKVDFVRFISLLSQFKKDGNAQKVARGYKSQMERYYEEYIYSVVGESSSPLFEDFLTTFPDKEFVAKFELLRQAIDSLEIPKEYSSIIELDVYFFGLIYSVLFQNKSFRFGEKENLKAELATKATDFKNDPSHAKAPGALKYLRSRIDSSIEIFKKYENE